MNSRKKQASKLLRKSFGKRGTKQGEIVEDSRPRVLRWIRLLKNYVNAHGYLGMEKLIQAANPNDNKWRINDDKLKRLVTQVDGKVNLTLNEIIALDRFFSQLGEGANKNGLFERSILEPVAHYGKVSFVLGASKDRDEVWNVVRRWDSQAMAEILAALTGARERLQVEVKDVLRDQADKDTTVWKQTWHQYLRDEKQDAPSLISIGSPLANPASEWTLAKMFGVKPFQGPHRDLPFHFVWPPHVKAPFPSSFAFDVGTLESIDRDEAKKVLKSSRGLLHVRRPLERPGKFKQSFHSSVRLQETGKKPAIIVAQQRRSGQVSMVIAGVSGPGTFAAARYLAKSESYSLPEPEGKNEGNLWIGIVESEVVRRPYHGGDEVDVGEPELLTFFEYPSAKSA